MRRADQTIRAKESEFAAALGSYVLNGTSREQKGRAFDLKLFVEQMNEVARAVADVTGRCGEGERIDAPLTVPDKIGRG